MGNAGIVHQDVQFSKGSDGLINHPFYSSSADTSARTTILLLD
jgi:hypothetical protein